MVSLQKKVKVIGRIPVIDRIEGEIACRATLEKYPNGSEILTINMSGMTSDILRRGFSLGENELCNTSED